MGVLTPCLKGQEHIQTLSALPFAAVKWMREVGLHARERSPRSGSSSGSVQVSVWWIGRWARAHSPSGKVSSGPISDPFPVENRVIHFRSQIDSKCPNSEVITFFPLFTCNFYVAFLIQNWLKYFPSKRDSKFHSLLSFCVGLYILVYIDIYRERFRGRL